VASDPPSEALPPAEADRRPETAPPPGEAAGPPDAGPPVAGVPGRRLALQTALFSLLTGFSRIAGLIREVVAAAYYGTQGAMSAFTFAFLVPNLIRSLFADSALQAAFIPVFTELLEGGKRRDAFRLAGAMFGLILAALGLVTLLMLLIAPWLMPALTGGEFGPRLDSLTVGLSRVLFPIVVLLGLNGLVVGVLNAHDHFSIPALAPVIWNVVIIVSMVALQGLFEGDERIYAYAIGVLAGTLVQLAMSIAAFRSIGFSMRISFDWRDRRIRQILLLMLPVTIGLGLINFNMLINTRLGSELSEEAAAAIDKAFRIYMLPQGMFSVAVATVLFPALSRLASRDDRDGLRAVLGTGTRQIALLLIPAMVATVVLAEPMTRVVYERGRFDAESTDMVSEALFWFSFSLPFSGVNLLLTRTFFSLQRPWMPTALAGLTLLVNAIVSVSLYKRFGIGGIVFGTVVASAVMTIGQALALRRELDGLEAARTLRASAQMLVAALVLGAVAYGVWWGLDALLGDSLLGQVTAVGTGVAVGTVVYAGIVLALRIPEARDIAGMLRARLPRAGAP
jgi:putative peptidoglycan lipid II flippase